MLCPVLDDVLDLDEAVWAEDMGLLNLATGRASNERNVLLQSLSSQLSHTFLGVCRLLFWHGAEEAFEEAGEEVGKVDGDGGESDGDAGDGGAEGGKAEAEAEADGLCERHCRVLGGG